MGIYHQMNLGYGIQVEPMDKEFDNHQEFYEEYYGIVRENTPFELVHVYDSMTGNESSLLLILRATSLSFSPKESMSFCKSFSLTKKLTDEESQGLDFTRDFAILHHEDLKVYAGFSIS